AQLDRYRVRTSTSVPGAYSVTDVIIMSNLPQTHCRPDPCARVSLPHIRRGQTGRGTGPRRGPECIDGPAGGAAGSISREPVERPEIPASPGWSSLRRRL